MERRMILQSDAAGNSRFLYEDSIRRVSATALPTFSERDLAILASDLIEAFDEDGCGTRTWLDRIGGPGNLESYLDCIQGYYA